MEDVLENIQMINGTIATPKGFHADGLHCGLKKSKKDIGWIYSEIPAEAAGVYTTNQIKAAPIKVTKATVDAQQKLQAIIVNSAVANACTGEAGYQNCVKMQNLAAEALEIKPELVAVASTGVIGRQLPMEKIAEGIQTLKPTEGNAYGFHEAILTTDLLTKEISIQAQINQQTVTMSGVAKGSGMIHPNMATMLSFVTTDAKIDGQLLQKALREVVDSTYNQITVDGDTSTNDMVLVLANGAAANESIEEGSEAYVVFKQMLAYVSKVLAQKIARDGEGATKLIEVTVVGGENTADSRMIAKKIVGSSLVKSAIFGEDPNWGRIICAAGYAGCKLDPDVVDIWIGTEKVLKDSSPVAFNKINMKEILAQDTVKINVDLKIGSATGVAWGCDLTYQYVEINACYHT